MVFADVAVAAVKVGMLGAPDVVEAVAAELRKHPGVPVVLDPSWSRPQGRCLAATRLSPQCGTTCSRCSRHNAQSRRGGAPRRLPRPLPRGDGARRLHLRGTAAAAWLVKGDTAWGGSANDLLVDGTGQHWFSAPRIKTRNTHGTGCTLSSAIAAFLARGEPLGQAFVRPRPTLAKRYAGRGV